VDAVTAAGPARRMAGSRTSNDVIRPGLPHTPAGRPLRRELECELQDGYARVQLGTSQGVSHATAALDETHLRR
jgi:hypothetical protein